MANDKVVIIIPAAGFGKRMDMPIAKQFLRVSGKTILEHTVNKFISWAAEYNHSIEIIVAISKGVDIGFKKDNLEVCDGGLLRADSVLNALKVIDRKGYEDGWVMVHDAARPLISISDIESLYQEVKNTNTGGILAERVSSTVKRVILDNSGMNITETIPREDILLAQTPQMFLSKRLKDSLERLDRNIITDEASAIEMQGISPKVVISKNINIKVTTKADLKLLELML